MSFKSHRLTENIKLLQKIVVKSDNQILLVRREAGAFYRPGAWDLPGGNVEWPDIQDDDGLQDLHKLDAVRELREETGIEITANEIGNQPIYFGTYFEADRNLYTMIVGWSVELPASFDPENVKLSHEHTEFAWVELSRLGEYDFGFAGDKEGFIGRMLGN